MPGGGETVEVRLGQPLARRDCAPQRGIVCHLLFQRAHDAIERRRRDAEPISDAVPHPLPAKDVAVDDVERFVVRCVGFRRPDEVAGELPRIGHVGQARPLRRRSGKRERPPRLAAQRRIDRERRAHVHGIADGETDHGMRAMDAPGEAVARGGGEHLVLLRVIEICDVEPSLLLAERRLRQRALSIGLERPEIMFQAGDQRDMAGARRLGEAVEKIAHHSRVDADVLRLAVLPQPRRDEDGVGGDAAQRRGRGARVQQICGDRLYARLAGRTTGEAMDRPALLDQQCRRRAADDPARANHQCRLRHSYLLDRRKLGTAPTRF